MSVEKLSPPRQDRVRNLIRANRIVVRLQQFVLGREFQGKKVVMSPAQVRAAEVLLRKLVPDLTAIEHSGEVTQRNVAELPEVPTTAEEWAQRYLPTRQ